MGLLISMRRTGDVTIVDLRGRSTLNPDESELLSGHLEKLVGKGACKLLLNVSDLTQIDSSGVSIIVGTYVRLGRQGGALKLLRPRGRVLEVLSLFHLQKIIPSFEDEAQALASFEPLSSLAVP